MDHLVLATPQLEVTVAWFTASTGVAPRCGGSHVGFGSANYLLGLGGSRYLEIVGPDPAQPAPESARPFGIDNLDRAALVTWAIAVDDMDAAITAARAGGVDPGDAHSMSRRTETGEILRWQLTPPTFLTYHGLVPFLIDWGETTHPTARGLPAAELTGWRATHPDPERITAALRALGAGLDVALGKPQLTATITGPTGAVTLG